MRTFTRKSTLPLSALLAAIAVASCQAYPPIGSVPTAAQSQARDAHVTADLGALLAKLQTRHVLGQGFNEPAITQYRMTAKGPNMTAVTSTPVAAPVPDKGQAYHTLGTAPVIQLDVPSGVNRVFLLEGLDAEGHVLASLATLTSLSSGASLALTFGADYDVAARVLERVLQSDRPSFPNVAPFFTDEQTVPLRAFINRVITGPNQQPGVFAVNPLAIDREFIVGKLRAEGTSFFGGTNLPAELTTSVWGRLNLVVTGADGKSPVKVDSAQITIFDPVSLSAYGSTANTDTGEVTFSNLPQGTWAVRVSVPGFPDKWETVTVSGTTFARVSPFTAPVLANAYTLSEVEGGATAIASSPDGGSLAVWCQNGEVSRVVGIFLDASHQPVGEVFYIEDVQWQNNYNFSNVSVCYDPAGQKFLVTYIREQNQSPREAVGREVSLVNEEHVVDSLVQFPAAAAYSPTRVVAAYGPDGKYAIALANSYAIDFKEYWSDGDGGYLSSSTQMNNCTSVSDPSLAYNSVTHRYVMAWAESGYDSKADQNFVDISTYTVGDESLQDAWKSRIDLQNVYGDFGHPVVAQDDAVHGSNLIAWEDTSAGAIRATLFDSNAQGTAGSIQDLARGDVHLSSIATLPHGTAGAARYLVGWQEGSADFGPLAYHTLGEFGNPRPVVRFVSEDGTPEFQGAIKVSDSDGLSPAVGVSTTNRSFVALWNTSDFGSSALYARVMP